MSVAEKPLAATTAKPSEAAAARGSVFSAVTENLPAVVFLILLLVLWEVYVRTFDVHAFILPAPSAVAEVIADQYPNLFRHTLVTTSEILFGFVIGNMAAIIGAIVITNSRLAEQIFYPLIIASQTIPKIAIAPLFLIWLGTGLAPKVVITAILCFFPTLVNTVQGLRTVDPNAVDLFRLVAASRTQLFLKLQFPNALPFVFAGLKISIALAVIGAIVAEWIGASQGLGYLVMYGSQTLRTDLTFAALACIAVLGMALYLAVVLVERLISWEPADTPIGGL
ncbi:MAG: transporter permease [Thermomicrobiales bacterium]|nr:transporter permease [Thermomicrobiales bacterium]